MQRISESESDIGMGRDGVGMIFFMCILLYVSIWFYIP